MARPKSEGFVRRGEAKRRKQESGAYVVPVAKRTPGQRAQVRRDQRSRLTPRSFASQRPARRTPARSTGRRAVSPVFTNPNPTMKSVGISTTPKLKYFPVVRNLKDAQAIAFHQSKVLGVAPVDLTGQHAQQQIANVLRSKDPNQRAAARQLDRVIKAIDKYEKQHPEVRRENPNNSYAKPGKTKRESTLSKAAGIPGKVLGERGYLAKAAAWVAKNLPESIPVEAGTATGPKLLPGATVPGARVRADSKIAANIGKDGLTLPATTITSLFLAGKAGGKALTGDTREGKKLVDDFLNNDPIALLAQGRVKEAGRSAHDHPVSTLLEVMGGKAAAGRAGGAVARRGTPAMRRAGSTRRTPQRLYGDHTKAREYSPDLIRASIQRATDRGEAAHDTRPNVRLSHEKQVQAEVRKIADEQVAVGEGIRRQNRNELIAKYMPTASKQKVRGAAKHLDATERGIVGLVIDRTLRSPETVHDDLLNYYSILKTAQKELEGSENPVQREANAKMIKRVEAAIRDGVDSDQLFKVADEYQRASAPVERELIERGLLEPGRAEKAREVPYAVTHMGAKETDLTPRFREHHKVLGSVAQKARVVEDKAYRRWVATRSGGGKPVQSTIAFKDLRVGDEIKYGHSAGNRFYRVAKVVKPKVGGRVAIYLDGRPGRVIGSPTNAVKIRRQGRALAEDAKAAYLEAKALRMDAEAAVIRHNAEGKRGPHLVDPEGNVLDAAAIRAHRESAGVSEPAFYGQRVEQNVKNAMYQNKFPKRGNVSNERRTGEATRTGAFTPEYADVFTHLIRAQGLLDWAKQFDRLVSTFGIKENGKLRQFSTAKDARKFLDSDRGKALVEEQRLPELVPVRVSPLGAKNSTASKIIKSIEDASDETAKQAATENVMSEMLREADPDFNGPVVLVPRDVWQHLQKHYRQDGGLARFGQTVNNTFKNVVLPTSPKWIAGNIIDNTIRLLLAGAGPRDVRLGKQLIEGLRSIDGPAAEELAARALGGMHYSTKNRMEVHRTTEDFKSGVGEYAHIAGQSRPAQVVVAPWRFYRDTVFDLNSRLEQVFEHAAVGRVARRQVRSATGRWEKGLKIQPKAMEDLANGLRGTDAQIQFAREMRKITGNWTTYSREARAVLFEALPFGAWMKNALQFVFVTMPRDHQVQTGIIAAIGNMTREERALLGLEPFRKNSKPDFLQGGIPYKGGQIPFQGFTSFGFAGSMPTPLGTMPFAWLQSPMLATRGLDWKGDKIKNSDDSELSSVQRSALAAYLFAEALVPLVALSRRVREQGGKQQGPSYIWKVSTKPGTKKGTGPTLRKIFNPFEPTYGAAGPSKSVPSTTPEYDWGSYGKQLDVKYDWGSVK